MDPASVFVLLMILFILGAIYRLIIQPIQHERQEKNTHLAVLPSSPSETTKPVIQVNGWWFIWWWWKPILMRTLNLQRPVPTKEAQKVIATLWQHRNAIYPEDTDDDDDEEQGKDDDDDEKGLVSPASILEADPPPSPPSTGEEDTSHNDDDKEESEELLTPLKQAGAAYDFESILQRDEGAFLLLLKGCVFQLDLLYRANSCKLSPRTAFVRNQKQDTGEDYTRKFTATDYQYLVGSLQDKGILRKAGLITQHQDGGYDCWPFDTVEEAWAKLIQSQWFRVYREQHTSKKQKEEE